MYIEIDKNNCVLGYSEQSSASSIHTDKSVPSFTDTQILKYENGNFIVEDSQTLIDEKAEYNAQEYARNRATAYPSTGDQLDKIYHDGLTKWKSEMVDPVKTKWPKDNSGPV